MVHSQNNRDTKQTSRRPAGRLLALLVLLALGASTTLLATPSLSALQGVSHTLAQPNWFAHSASSQQRRNAPGAIALSLTPLNTSFAANTQSASNAPTSLSIDALSDQLATYLSTLGLNAGVEVYDATHQFVYTDNDTASFLTASSIKVPIMLAFLAQTESQEREPDGDEMNLLTAMIENSDNDAASALYADIQGATGLANFLQQSGVSGLAPDSDAWGYSQITPQAMVDLLTQLYNGTILTANDRATALDLMQHVEADQQWGVGDTAPAGATFAMKNGWVPGPDGLWAVNTSGIVSSGNETYIISVYTQEQSSFAAGEAIVQQICNDVASTLR